MSVKFFIESTPSGLYRESFTVVFYDRNDSGLNYKTNIVTNLALAIVIYDHNECYKLNCTL